MSYSSVFKVSLKVLRSSADRHLYDSEFETEGALAVNACADSASVIFGTNSNNLSDDRNVFITQKQHIKQYQIHRKHQTVKVNYIKKHNLYKLKHKTLNAEYIESAQSRDVRIYMKSTFHASCLSLLITDGTLASFLANN